MNRLIFLLILVWQIHPASALELQGFVTNDCRQHIGVIVHASGNTVETMDLDGRFQSFTTDSIDAVYVFNLITNPFSKLNIDPSALKRLKRIYVNEDDPSGTLAFPVRFIEDLILFYSLEGKSHVYRMADIYKIRPAPESALGEHASQGRNPGFEFSDQAAKCPAPAKSGVRMIKPTRVLADKISIAEFLGSFEQGYDRLESFQERTYLYAKPFLFEPNNRLGLIFTGKREEVSELELPVYFQWSTGEPYRFQSFNVVGQRAHEFTPNTEPVLSLRTDVKSHAFHALFIGNALALSAGSSAFSTNEDSKLDKKDLTVQSTFNYMALMGGDYGPYSLSGGFYFPTFAVKVGDEMREILGSKASYAVRFMYTKRNLRARAIGSLTEYQSGQVKEDQVISKSPIQSGPTPKTFEFDALFLRAGLDYSFSPQFSASLDGIYLAGNYRETKDFNAPAGLLASDIKFTKWTTQMMLRQSFGRYVALSAYVNLVQSNYESNFLGKDLDRQRQGLRYFGSLEFIF